MIHTYALFFVQNHVFEATKKSGFLEIEKQKFSVIQPQNQNDIKKMIGEGIALGGRIIGRVHTGEIFPIYSNQEIYVEEDVVQSRILWLSGLEDKLNKGEGVDSFSRYIYIHGTPEEWLLGTKASKGCIRMSNKDVIDLFDKVHEGMVVNIK